MLGCWLSWFGAAIFRQPLLLCVPTSPRAFLPPYAFGGQRTTVWSWFSPCTLTWVPEIKLWSPDLACTAGTSTLWAICWFDKFHLIMVNSVCVHKYVHAIIHECNLWDRDFLWSWSWLRQLIWLASEPLWSACLYSGTCSPSAGVTDQCLCAQHWLRIQTQILRLA